MKDLIVTIIQSHLSWQNKTENLAMFEEKIHSISGSKQVVLLPEMFSTGFSMKPELLAEDMHGPTLIWMREMAAKYRIILAGSLIIQANNQYFNRFIWMQPNGQYNYYDKRHLFAYGGEDKAYTPGNERIIVQVNGWRILLQVCYDLRFPVWSRQQLDSDYQFEYDLIIYVANWPEKRSIAWKSLLPARAIENQSFVIGVNRVGQDAHGYQHAGDSQIINPLGEIMLHLADKEAIETYTLSGEKLLQMREKFPFNNDADTFTITK